MNWRYFLLIALFLQMQHGFSQNKYALLIGINKYQKKNKDNTVGIDSANSLKGCVNDAKSIKELMISEFGFKPANIKELYDFAATRKNILAAINSLLLKCKPGDVAVIYYAGHGSTFRYGENATQTAEYILPSDGFSNYRRLPTDTTFYEYSFIQTSLLANLFNKFVDKKVALTALFDCCNSKGTIGIKKTVNTRAVIDGVPKILSRSFWENAVEMAEQTTNPVRKTGLIKYAATDFHLKNVCKKEETESTFSSWLNANANITLRDSCKGTTSWMNDFNPGNWKVLCGKTRQVKVLFTVKNDCGQSDTSTATYRITDAESPAISAPAKDLTVFAGTENTDSLFKNWLSLNGGAMASDGCTDSVIWTNNFDSTAKVYFDVSGSILVTFTAMDACGNASFTSATFTVADEIDPLDYRLTAQESSAIIHLLTQLDNIREYAKRYGYYSQPANLKPMILKQLDSIAALEKTVSQRTKYKETGSLYTIQGTSLMVTLTEAANQLMDLLSLIPYKEADQIAISIPTSNTSKTDDSQGISRNANNSKLVLPNGFPYKEYEFKPPSQLPESKFVFMSATDDLQLAKEKKINNVSNGVFTAALIEVFKNTVPGTKITEVFEKVKQQFKLWNIVQTPTLRVAEKRKNQNLIGTGN